MLISLLMSHVVLLTVRTALVALIAFMPTNPNGALGSLDYKKEERRALAIKSREVAPRFGNPERQKLIDEVCFPFSFFLFLFPYCFEYATATIVSALNTPIWII